MSESFKSSRLYKATRAVWRRSYESTRVQPWWEQVQPAVEDVLAYLRHFTREDALQSYYWAAGDAIAAMLRRHTSITVRPEDLLQLEEACFWLRLRELCADGYV